MPIKYTPDGGPGNERGDAYAGDESDPNGKPGTCDKCSREGTVYEGEAEVTRGGKHEGVKKFLVCRKCAMDLILGRDLAIEAAENEGMVRS